MYRKYLLAFFLCSLFPACQKSAPDGTIVIKGINMRDTNAYDMGKKGEPDVHTDAGSKSILCYPNPCNDVCMLAVKVPDTGNVQIIIKAAKYKDASGGDVKNSDLFGKEAVYNASQAVNAGSNNVALNTATYPMGFYRVYVVSGIDTLWDNIQIKH